MNITEFLLARIAEDELRATYYGPLAMGTARILTECAAERAIIGRYVPSSTPNPYDLALHDVIHDLAAVYKDHPDYQQEWAL